MTASLTATPRLYDFANILVDIDNPLSNANGSFGRQFDIDGGSNIVGTINNSTSKSAAVFNITGTEIQQIARQSTAGSPYVVDVDLAMSQGGNYITLLEENTNPTVQTQDMHLYKRNSSTGQYTHIDDYTLPATITSTNLAVWNLGHDHCMTDTFLVINDLYYDPDPITFIPANGRVFVFSFTESGGWVKEREHLGTRKTVGSFQKEQQLGCVIATNNTNYVIGEDYSGGNVSSNNDYNLYVYRHSDGALVRTISNNIKINSIQFDPDNTDIIVAATQAGIRYWNINTGASIGTTITTGQYSQWRRYTSDLVVLNNSIVVDENTGNEQGTINPAVGSNDIRFVGTKMIHGDPSNNSSVGRIRVREED
jgi:WD40 repeat protein